MLTCLEDQGPAPLWGQTRGHCVNHIQPVKLSSNSAISIHFMAWISGLCLSYSIFWGNHTGVVFSFFCLSLWLRKYGERWGPLTSILQWNQSFRRSRTEPWQRRQWGGDKGWEKRKSQKHLMEESSEHEDKRCKRRVRKSGSGSGRWNECLKSVGEDSPVSLLPASLVKLQFQRELPRTASLLRCSLGIEEVNN